MEGELYKDVLIGLNQGSMKLKSALRDFSQLVNNQVGFEVCM